MYSEVSSKMVYCIARLVIVRTYFYDEFEPSESDEELAPQ